MANQDGCITDVTDEQIAAAQGITPTAAPAAPADVVEAWFIEHFHNQTNPLSSELYNTIYELKEDLKARLAA